MTEELINKFVDPGEFSSRRDGADGRTDPSGRYPRAEYVGVSSVNNVATGAKTKNVYLGGSAPNVDLDLSTEPTSDYTQNQVKETASGHVIEYDDTYGRERIMLRHRTGSGVEMRADGSVIISSTKNSVKITAADEKVIVEGDGEVIYNGNLKMRVAGDFDMEVGGDFNVKVGGDVEKNIRGSYIKEVIENYEKRIVGNSASFIVGAATETTFGNKNNIIKGNFDNTVEGNTEFAVKGEILMTSADGVIVTSPDVNIVASSLSVLGDSGTIGGANMVYYGHTAHIPRVNSTSVHATAMYATTFHGDLNGVADKADEANKAGTAAIGATGTGGTPTVNSTTAADSDTSQPTTATISDLINNSSLGVRVVEVDTFGDLKNATDRTADYGGISKFDLTTEAARSKLRDPNNLNNTTFIATLLSDGTISKNFVNSTAPNFGRVVSADKIAVRGTESMGKQSAQTRLFTNT
ncbi:MAG: hypothetical protein CMD57_01820 [Gammaproteobacteria bacterium]|nr:hypothetical protein [Gammaproteobacteria bacterium]